MRRLAGVIAGLALLTPPASAATVQVEVDGVEPGGGQIRVVPCRGGLSEPFCTPGDDALRAHAVPVGQMRVRALRLEALAFDALRRQSVADNEAAIPLRAGGAR